MNKANTFHACVLLVFNRIMTVRERDCEKAIMSALNAPLPNGRGSDNTIVNKSGNLDAVALPYLTIIMTHLSIQ